MAVTRRSFSPHVPLARAAVVVIVVSCVPALLGQSTILPRDAAVREYEIGLSALKKREFRTAKERMNAALATGHTRPSEEFGTGRNQLDWYDPYYWLGVASMELGEDASARRYFTLSREGGVIQKRAEYADLLERIRVLEARQASPRPSPSPGPTPPPPRPAVLAPLIEAIAQGRFADAEAELAKARSASPEAAEPELLAAVLYASRFVLEGSLDRSLLTRARASLEVFRRRGGSQRAEEAWLSPALRALLAG